MLVKWLGIYGLCIAIGLVIAFAPEFWSSETKAIQQVNSTNHDRLVRACVKEAEQKLKAMGPFVGWDTNEVWQKCEAAVDERVRVSN
jgi:hypothetical protein